MTYFTAVRFANKPYSNSRRKRFKAPLPRRSSCEVKKKLKMFTSLSKKKAVSSQGRTMILKANRSLFGRMIITGQRRKIVLKDMLKHSLGPMP